MKRTQSQSSMHYPFLENETYSTLSSRSKLIFHACFQLWTKRGEKPVTIDKYLNRYIALYISEETFDFSKLYKKVISDFKKLGLTLVNRKMLFILHAEDATKKTKISDASCIQKDVSHTQKDALHTQNGLKQTTLDASHIHEYSQTHNTQTPIHHNFTSTSSLKKRRR